MNQRIPQVGTNIFSTMSALAMQHQAINLSQGFPDFAIDQELGMHVDKAIKDGYNQYAPMTGLLDLRKAISKKIEHFQSVQVNPDTEITITPGATYAIYTAFATILNAGDEVIVLEPAYDSYIPNLQLLGAKPVPVVLSNSNFAVDWQKVKDAITNKTKAIIFTNPHNPSGTIWSKNDFLVLESLVLKYDLYIIADEVYEHLVYDQQLHQSILSFPALRAKAFATYSFGKVFHNTGWKMGYCVAPPTLMESFRMIHQFLAFSVHTPSQQALAWYLADLSHISKAAMLLEEKRNLFLKLIQDTKFKCLKPSAGSYFQLIDYSEISDMPDKEFAIWLTKEHKVATIPLSPFYTQNYNNKLLRVCFAKKETTLLTACKHFRNI